MNGREHYAEAEKLLTDAEGYDLESERRAALERRAGVHATLAAAAAHADLALITLALGPVHTGTLDRTVFSRRLQYGKGATS